MFLIGKQKNIKNPTAKIFNEEREQQLKVTKPKIKSFDHLIPRTKH